jgi:hypothetical protein
MRPEGPLKKKFRSRTGESGNTDPSVIGEYEDAEEERTGAYEKFIIIYKQIGFQFLHIVSSDK